MDPKTVHVSTAQLERDSGKKLGFTDIPANPRHSIASAQNTPSRSVQKTDQLKSAPSLTFPSATEAILSHDAQKMMETVREDAARIKAEMKAQKELQDQKDGEAERMFNPYGRKLAQPKGRVGRYSDVHIAQFKKMDSIANHPSSFRARPGYAQPTATQSLKRSPSKAELDELERPRTAGKGTPGQKSFTRPLSRAGPSMIPSMALERDESASPAKRLRHSKSQDVSLARAETTKPSGIPKSTSSLFSPTKSSLARNTQSVPPAKPSMLPRSQTAKGMREAARKSLGRTSVAMSKFTSKLLEAQQESRKASPVVRTAASTANLVGSTAPQMTPAVMTVGPSSFSSRLPTFSGLKSILRSPQKATDRPGTPKRPNTAAGIPESSKKVDFTPSVKSRYAEKLTNYSPSPAKLAQDNTPRGQAGPVIPYDPAAYVLGDDESWEDINSSPVEYPSLPELPVEPRSSFVHTIQQNAPETDRHQTREFKSIFTTLHPKPRFSGPQAGYAPIPEQIRKPPNSASSRQSRPSTIRRVRSSLNTNIVQPFADTEVSTMEHGLPAKKRRRESVYFDSNENNEDDAKENRPVPGAWNDNTESDPDAKREWGDSTESDPDAKRAKRAKTLDFKDIDTEGIASFMSPKKKSAAREAAARNARDRKSMIPGQSKGAPARGLSMGRLNMLSQPKSRV